MRSSTRLVLTAPTLAVLLLAGCTPIVALKPAADAVNPDCAKVIVALPETVADLPSRETDAQATAAWGNPTGVILRCGVPAPAPTATLPCITVQGVDWLRDGSNDPNFVFTTYGREPAVEVILNGTQVSGLATLTDLSAAVAKTPASRQCISPEDTTK
jgi:hypothetical protein